MKKMFTLVILSFGLSCNASSQFVHPGGLHTQADLDRTKAKVAAYHGDQFHNSVITQTEKNIQSPDGNLSFNFFQRVDPKGKKQMYYRISYKDKPVILESAIDVQLDNHISQLALALKPVD